MKRAWVSAAMVGSGVSRALLGLRQLTRAPWLTVLTYHRVLAGGAQGAIDPTVVTDATVFDEQLGLLSRFFNFVGMDEVVAATRGAPLPPSPMLVTFDDGYRDNYDIALPLLKKHGARATFFITTSYLDERRLFWWDRIHWVVRNSRREALELRFPTRRLLALGPDASAREQTLSTLLTLVKTHFALDLPRFLEHLEEAAGVSLSRTAERVLAAEHLMTWQQVRALRAEGMDVQSHTRTHRVVQTLPIAELVSELRTSRARLREVLDADVTAVSYPVGRAPLYSDAIREAVRAAGYRVAFSNRSGVNPCGRFDAMDLKRISLEDTSDKTFFEAVMAVPALAY